MSSGIKIGLAMKDRILTFLKAAHIVMPLPIGMHHNVIYDEQKDTYVLTVVYKETWFDVIFQEEDWSDDPIQVLTSVKQNIDRELSKR
jgi:hypothetical protein